MTACPREPRAARPGLVPALLMVLAVATTLSLPAPRAYAEVDPTGEWPLRPQPDVVAAFDPPESTWGSGHRGVDLTGRPGQPVHAALSGRIAFVGTVAGRPVVTVSHRGSRTTYEPVGSTLARGAPVAAGQVIGSLGVTGSHCFPRACLHWGWIRDDTYLDPLRLVGGGPVRLLPLDGRVAVGSPMSGAVLPRTSPYAGWSAPVDGLRLWP